MAKQSLATLLTDFGTRDPYVAAMKGVILAMCPRAQLVDISHDVEAHDILSGAFILAHAAPYFPAGTLHVVVVDPGVGTDRRILAARFGGQVFLFPDNGIISMIAETMPLEEIVAVRNTRYLPPAGTSMTFHGRDIFAPLAGRILNGLDIKRLGPQPGTYKLLDLPAPAEQAGAMVGEVIFIDRFGNLISNIRRQQVRQRWKDLERLSVLCRGRDVGPLQGTYEFVEPGRQLALLNSMGFVEVAVNRGRACDELDAGVGAEVRITEQ